ncbi:MAG: hypothetical protein HRT61_07915 [Ekhidna sp.]|nr:hypothetical protein [Ekhidna sp.]
MEDKIIVGLDIGTTKICVIVGKKNELVSTGSAVCIPRTLDALNIHLVFVINTNYETSKI